MTSTDLTARTLEDQVLDVLGDLREAVLYGPGDAAWLPDYADRILALIAPPQTVAACAHEHSSNRPDGYIACTDCDEWLGVWRCLK